MFRRNMGWTAELGFFPTMASSAKPAEHSANLIYMNFFI